MEQIYHNYNLWEDYKSGMWRKLKKQEEKEYLQKAVDFTGDADLYGHWMIQVVKNWKYSCEHNLTDVSQNRRAWIGHAACQLAINCPEYITRQAWGFLSKDQQDKANAVADKAILLWESKENNGGSKNGQIVFEY